MEHGPIDDGPADAGPNVDSEYGGETSRRSAVHQHQDAADGGGGKDPKRLSSGSIADAPLYPQVGATLAEASGEVCVGRDGQVDGGVGAEATGPGAKPLRLHKFMLYETTARYWITGGDVGDQRFKLLRIDRTSAPGQISLFEDDTVYDRRQINDVLASIDEGNRATGGLRVKCSFWGVLGFIRFTEAYYMVIITKRGQVAMIGGHYVYQIEATEQIPLTTGSSSRFSRDRNPEEARFLGILNNLDLSKSFYFSYSYDITQSLQHNIIRQREATNQGLKAPPPDHNSMFVWNAHLLKPAKFALRNPFEWCLPIIHGFIDQSALDIFGRSVYITIIGRRSRHFAGARFLKRGINDSGYVANDVETEQIVSEMLTTSFHAPGPRLFSNPTYTSYVHHRGSIPLYWTQDNSGVTPKPDIDLNLQDPFYQPAALHFDDLFKRYGCPIYVLNLIKARERTPRESKLLHAFKDAIDYLNLSLPEMNQIRYRAFDMSRASKTRGGDVIGSLEVIAEEIMAQTGFFHNGDAGVDEPQVQNGIARTNCIDCLDRTNAAQFVIGKRAFGQQLQALGVLDRPDVDYDTDAVNIFTHMFHDHGDTIAVQYGGSHLVNTMATYRKLNHWQSHSRDMVESFKRYYHNSFLDSQRQEAYNLFLGNYIWAQGQPMLWDLATDYYLHHSDPKAWLKRSRRDYITWYTPEHLQPRVMPPRLRDGPREDGEPDAVSAYDDFWVEYYRPTAISSFLKVYSYRMNSSNRYLPDRPHRDTKQFDFSPFKPRLEHHRGASIDSPDKKPRKGVKILEPQNEQPQRSSDPTTTRPYAGEGHQNTQKPSILRSPRLEKSLSAPAIYYPHHDNDNNNNNNNDKTKPPAPDKTLQHQWTLNQFHTNSLNPAVNTAETAEYTRYISHPLNLPLVISTELPTDANHDYVEYVHKAGGAGFAGEEEEGEEEGGVGEEDLERFEEFLTEWVDCLDVKVEDGGKKRYKAYRQWLLRGKSLFKQSKVDPEFRPGM
ncbi:hypothetical protein MBLNU230_g3008t1 [Neophaeotheca triangularis]